MASWLRLWHDMPNDPKWRTIARISAQPISLVQATYLHLLVTASRNVTRGHVDVTNEDLASALDVTEDAIASIINAMQGRVMNGSMLSGWEKRQPAREDAIGLENGSKPAAERKRAQREREKIAKQKSECHDTSRNVTQCHAPDTDTDTDNSNSKELLVPSQSAGDSHGRIDDCPHQEIIALYHEMLPECPRIKTWHNGRASNLRQRWREEAKRQSLDWWQRYFAYVGKSPFLTGKTPGRNGGPSFVADLEWLTKAGNLAKVIEGKYHQDTNE